MPALSENLKFVVNGTTTTSVVYPVTTTTAQTFVSDPIKAANYYGINNSVQTVEIKITDFVGTITMQASLATDPVENDWFSVDLLSNDLRIDTTGLVSRANKKEVSYNFAFSDTQIYNFEGNFVWLRAKISSFTEGVVNGVTINY